MKVVFKLLSENFSNGHITEEDFALKFEKIIDTAFRSGIRIWHAGKKVELTKDIFKGSVNLRNMTINWGGYGSSISKEKLFEYFQFMYPGDTEIDGAIKSKVNSRNNPFTLCHAVFGSDVEPQFIEQYKALGGTVDGVISQNTLLVVSDNTAFIDDFKGQCTVHGWTRILVVGTGLFQTLFPSKPPVKVQSAGARKSDQSVVKSLYADDVLNSSIVNDRNQFSKVKKLLTNDSIEIVDSGLMMLEGLGDRVLIDSLLEGVEMVNFEIAPNALFSGTKKTQPIRNYAIIGLINLVDANCLNSFPLKNRLSELHVDIPNLHTISKLTQIQRLVLVDSSQSLTSLEGMQNLTILNGLVLKDCPNVKSIDAIKGLPIREFEIGTSRKIESLQPLEGKFDYTGRKSIVIKKFENLKTLDGIEFYNSLETVVLDECDNLKDVKSLKKLSKLKEIKSERTYGEWNEFRLENLDSVDGLILPNQVNLQIRLNSWRDLPDVIYKDCKYLDIHCKSMRDLNWLSSFPNLIGLTVHSQDLLDVKGLKACQNLVGLIIESPVVLDLNAIAGLPNLIALNIEGCTKLRSIDFVLELRTLKLFGGFSDLLRVKDKGDSIRIEQLQQGVIGEMRELSVRDLPEVESWEPLFSLPFFQTQIDSLRVWKSNTLNFTGISKLANLKTLNISESRLTNELFTEVSKIRSMEYFRIFNCDQIEISNNIPLSCDLVFERCGIGHLKNGSFKLVKLIDSDFTEISNCEIGCLMIQSNYSSKTKNLAGLNQNRIKSIELESLEEIDDITGIANISELTNLSIKKLPRLQNISFLAGLSTLIGLYTEECDRLDVKPKPKGQMTKNDLLNYQLKIAEFYKLPNQNEISNLLKQLKATQSVEVSKKELSNIKKLLQSRDLDVVISGVDLVASLNNEALCSALLEGIGYDGNTIVPNRIFEGTGPAQPYLNTAMMGVLCSAVKYASWADFVSKISMVEMKIIVLDYLSCLKNVQSIKVQGVSKSGVILNLPELRSFVWQSMDWSSDLPKMSTAFNLNVFQNSVKLEKFVVEIPLDITGDFEGFSSFTNLKELDFIGIRENQINTIRHLSGCKSLETLRIQFDKSVIGGISDLEGLNNLIELKRLTICNTAIIDTGAICNLKNIEYLEILSPVLEHFTPCDDFSKLLELNFSASNYQSIGNCNSLKTIGESVYPKIMKQINLRGTSMKQFPSFRNLTEVGSLILSSTPVCDFSRMGTIQKIESLYLKNCSDMVDFTGFENVKEIGDLEITGCGKLISFKGLQNVNLKESRLDLSDCVSIASIEELPLNNWELIILDTAKLPSVKLGFASEMIRCCSVSDIIGIGNYINVRGFDFSQGGYYSKHPLCDYSPLRDIPKLKKLRINTDKVVSLESFAHFEHLEILNLVGCKQLTNPEKLANTHIDKLYIADCNLKKAQFPATLQDKIDWQSKP
jgi:hypothetical protein